MHKIYGIRHHGPGSAKSLLKGLRSFEPDCILIEGPADANDIIHYLNQADLVPPVSILIYNPDDFKQAAYYPFAEFSPEWQAMKYGLANGVKVRFMDLPQGVKFAMEQAEASSATTHTQDTETAAQQESIRRDPLGYLADLAGYSDGERWWEATFEHTEHDIDVFEIILELLTGLREDLNSSETEETLLREAYMRNAIRAAYKEGSQKIAVVCGAWHSPVFVDVQKKFKQKDDTALLKLYKPTKTVPTWIPWTYSRLSTLSGYGAGILSPAWYKLLFDRYEDAVQYFMIQTARLFREADIDASTAHIIEAVRLAETLATLRHLALPGINELYEAIVAIFCQGYESKMELIQKQLIIGDKMGIVPKNIPVPPLQKDIEKEVKSLRLTKYYQVTGEAKLGANAKDPEGGLDLRDEHQRKQSFFLRRLNIIGVQWGVLSQSKTQHRKQGSFKEYWTMAWKPDFALLIIEAGMWGNTVYEAAVNLIKDIVLRSTYLPEITKMAENVLFADLKDAVEIVVQQLENIAATTKDVTELIDAITPLVNIVRYGDARQTEVSQVLEVIDTLVPRICIGIPIACMSLNEDATKGMFDRIQKVHRAIAILDKEAYKESWKEVLHDLAYSNQASNLIAGGCLRLLFDHRHISVEETAARMSYELSRGNEPRMAAAWLEGFLHGSGQLLILQEALWKILDDWVANIPQDIFQEILPLIRRTFSQFPTPEREQMLSLAKRKNQIRSERPRSQDWDEERTMIIQPLLKSLLQLS